jgi:hypothetical protein
MRKLSASDSMARQAVLTRPDGPLKFWAVLHEAVLHQGFAVRPDTMRDQLRRLLDVVELPNVTLQIMPLAATPHPGGAGGFNLVGSPGRCRTSFSWKISSGRLTLRVSTKCRSSPMPSSASSQQRSRWMTRWPSSWKRKAAGEEAKGGVVRRESVYREVAQGIRERRRERLRQGRRTAARAVRDSKNPERVPLRFTASEWAAFRTGVIAGEL